MNPSIGAISKWKYLHWNYGDMIFHCTGGFLKVDFKFTKTKQGRYNKKKILIFINSFLHGIW